MWIYKESSVEATPKNNKYDSIGDCTGYQLF